MVKAKWKFSTLLSLIFLLSLTAWGSDKSFAQQEEPPQRHTTIVLSFTEYEWWLIRWSDNQIVCRIYIDHEGIPSDQEIYENCGENLYKEWKSTSSCEVNEKDEDDTIDCVGLYLHLISTYPTERTVVIDLPPATIWLALSDCSPTPPENLCENLPTLLLLGEEPLPNEQITAIHYILNDVTYTCEGNVCEVPLFPTPLEGVEIEFWGDFVTAI